MRWQGDDSAADRAACRRRGRIARQASEPSEKLSRHRWKAARTFAWLHRYCRLLVRRKRRADIHLGFLQVAGERGWQAVSVRRQRSRLTTTEALSSLLR